MFYADTKTGMTNRIILSMQTNKNGGGGGGGGEDEVFLA